MTELEHITCPEDLRRLSPRQLPRLAEQIRELILDTLAGTGGHLGPNLGVVELTIALHRVFESPRDTVLFDTGHQAYAHKILTGRREDFIHGLRRPGGLSGYPSRTESVHDVIENSHASTALSYADGIAKAHAIRGDSDRAVVAVIGDGALTGGMAYEALNNIGAGARPVVVVLNDNGHSYSPTAGSIAAHLRRLRERPPNDPSPTVFDQLGLTYLGPIDGHDIDALESALRKARDAEHPVVVHAVTIKGHGYEPACADAERMHTVGPRGRSGGKPAWTNVFGDELVEIGYRRDDIVAVTAAMPGPTGLSRFAEHFPARCFDVGIAEQHALTSAAGMATAGLHPVVAIYSTFLNRAFDQLLLDVGLHRLPVTLVLDRAGITGPDGPSHHGMWDLTLLATVPGLRVAAPRDATRLRELLWEAVGYEAGPTAVRYPKASVGPDIPAVEQYNGLDLLYRAPQRDVLLVGVGPLTAECLRAAGHLAEFGIAASVVDPRWVLPIPAALVGACLRHRLVVVAEDNSVSGAVAAALRRALTEAGSAVPVLGLGVPHRFLCHGERADLLAEAGLTGAGITHAVRRAQLELVDRQEVSS